MRTHASIVTAWIALALAIPAANALDPNTHISQYRHTAWRIKDGVLRGQPNDITQTPDGYIWIGTAAGLIRFDGVHLVPWEPPAGAQLPSSYVRSLLAASDGSLWIGTDSGLSHWTRQRLVTNLKDGLINSIVEDRHGRIWIARSRSLDGQGPLCQVSGSKPDCYRVPADAQGLHSLLEDGTGDLWMGFSTGLLRLHDGSITAHPIKNLEPNVGMDGVDALAPASDGSLWVGAAFAGPGMGLQRFAKGAWKQFNQTGFEGNKLAVLSLFLDRDQALWVGTDQGIYRIFRDRVDHFSAANGLSNNTVWGFDQDREGNVWVATPGGVDSFQDIPVVTFSTQEGLNADSVVSVLSTHEGTVWVGNAGSLDTIHNGVVSSIRRRQGLPGQQVTSLLEDHAGRLWVGVDDKLWIYEGGRFNEIKRADGSHIGTVGGIIEDVANDIWLVTIAPFRRLVQIRGFKVVEELRAPRIPDSRTLAADRRSGIWLGLLDGDLARYRDGNLEVISLHHNPNSRIRQMIVDFDNTVLGATASGLVGWKDGTVQTMTVGNGPSCDNIFSIIPDQNSYWLYTQCGLVEITREQMQRWWKQPSRVLQVNVIDQLDGVQPYVAPFSPAAFRSADGKLWFANNSVLQMFDPAHKPKNSVAPPVHIEEIVADRKTYPLTSELGLPASLRNLEIDYAALSFVAPEKIRFRYKLEGHDTEWQDPGTRRQAFYNDLAPRKYRFRVIAANNNGVWNDQGASLDFYVNPAYNQTTWFRALIGAAALVMIMGLYRIRLYQVRREFNAHLEGRVDERLRVARELHDTLLQSFQASLVQMQAARNLFSRRPEQAAQDLDSAIKMTAGAIAEGRGAIQQLRSEPASQADLPQLLTVTGQDLARANETAENPVSFRVLVEGEKSELKPLLQDEVYRIGSELLRNAFKHSQATEIEAEVRYEQRLLRVHIRDNGKGIDPKILNEGGRAGHWGLAGMNERAKQIGGRLDFWSQAGRGTEARLTVPASVAYQAPHKRWRFSMVLKKGAST